MNFKVDKKIKTKLIKYVQMFLKLKLNNYNQNQDKPKIREKKVIINLFSGKKKSGKKKMRKKKKNLKNHIIFS